MNAKKIDQNIKNKIKRIEDDENIKNKIQQRNKLPGKPK